MVNCTRRKGPVREIDEAFTAYVDAAGTVADLVDRISDDRWPGPGLDGWDLRTLVGHTSRALMNVLNYLDKPAHAEDIDSMESYYTLRPSQTGEGSDEAAVTELARRSGAELGVHPAGPLRELAERTCARLMTSDPAALIETNAGGIRVGSYVPTRTAELVVHGVDIAATVGLSVAFSHRALAEAATVLARTGVARGRQRPLGQNPRHDPTPQNPGRHHPRPRDATPTVAP